MTRRIVPREIYHPFFFSETEINWPIGQTQTFNSKDLFIYEIAYYSGLETIKPWRNPEHYIPELMDEWQILRTELLALFQVRDKKRIPLPMKQGVGLLIQCIFWSNGFPVTNEFDFSILRIKPVNATERIQFLMGKPYIYPSFIQLSELMEEQEKQFKIFMSIKRASKN